MTARQAGREQADRSNRTALHAATNFRYWCCPPGLRWGQSYNAVAAAANNCPQGLLGQSYKAVAVAADKRP